MEVTFRKLFRQIFKNDKDTVDNSLSGTKTATAKVNRIDELLYIGTKISFPFHTDCSTSSAAQSYICHVHVEEIMRIVNLVSIDIINSQQQLSGAVCIVNDLSDS